MCHRHKPQRHVCMGAPHVRVDEACRIDTQTIHRRRKQPCKPTGTNAEKDSSRYRTQGGSQDQSDSKTLRRVTWWLSLPVRAASQQGYISFFIRPSALHADRVRYLDSPNKPSPLSGYKLRRAEIQGEKTLGPQHQFTAPPHELGTETVAANGPIKSGPPIFAKFSVAFNNGGHGLSPSTRASIDD